MSVTKRGEIYHYDFFREGDRYRGSTKKRTKAAAEKWLREHYDEIVGEAPSASKTLGDVADEWFSADVAGRKSESTTAIRVEILLRHISPNKPICEIGTPEIAAAIAARRAEKTKQGREPSNATVNRDMIGTTLRPILNYARDVLELPVRNIAWKKITLPEPTERVRSFSPSEISRWMAAMPDHYHDLFRFFARYGVRLREAFFLPEQYNPETGVVTIAKDRRKNSRELTIRLLPADRLAMNRRWARAVKAGLQTVWFHDVDGAPVPLAPRGFQAASRLALTAAAIPDARPVHDLRHHAATTLLRASGNLAAAKRLLGHQDIASTMRYAHAADDDVTRALEMAYATKLPTKRKTPDKKPNRVNARAVAGSGT